MIEAFCGKTISETNYYSEQSIFRRLKRYQEDMIFLLISRNVTAPYLLFTQATHPTSFSPFLPPLSPPLGSQSKRRWRGNCHRGVALSTREHQASCNIIPPRLWSGSGQQTWSRIGSGGRRRRRRGRNNVKDCRSAFSFPPSALTQTSFCNIIWGQTIISTTSRTTPCALQPLLTLSFATLSVQHPRDVSFHG